MRFDGFFLYFKGKQIPVAKAQGILCLYFPNLIMDFVVKREVKNGQVICHVDWQGVFGTKLFQILIHSLTDETKENSEG